MGAYVELLSHSEGCEKVVAAAAKLCYSPADISDILEGLDEEKVKKFLDMLVSMGHESPIEHLSFTFGIEGVSRSLLAQITRHRIASYTVKSQRYVREGNFDYITPPEIADNQEALEIFEKAMADTQEAYDKIVKALEEKHFKDMIAAGIDEKKAKRDAGKKANEDARFVLPNACETKMVVTMNARSLLHFFSLRCCNRAQWEIRDLANQMLDLVKEKAPTIFRYAGPSCLTGPCPEGKMSCGKKKEMEQKYLGEK